MLFKFVRSVKITLIGILALFYNIIKNELDEFKNPEM